MEEEKEDTLDRSNNARANLTHTAKLCEEEVRNHIVSQNTAQAGLITWMKPGVNFQVNPSPINLLEALNYITERETYESAGTEVFDFYLYDVDTQFEIIMKILRPENNSVRGAEPKTR